MNEKEPIEVGLSTVIFVIIIFILIITMIFMYIYFKNFQNIEDNEIQNNKVNELNVFSNTGFNTIETKNNNSVVSSLNIESDEIKQLYNYIMKTNTNQEELVYRNTKVTEKDLNNQLKLITIFENISKNDAYTTKSLVDKYGYSTEHIYYKKEIIESVAKRIFGDNVSITHESCEAYFTQAREYKNGEYDCFEYQGGGGTPWEFSTSKLISAEQNGDEIYIYDKYVHIYEDIEYGKCDVYDSSIKSLKIAENVSSSNLSGDIIGNLENITSNKIKTFKHIFKKNSNGTYYWYSTEPVE